MRNPRLLAAFLLLGSLAGMIALWQAGAAHVAPDTAAQWLQSLAARPETRWLLFAAVLAGGLIAFPAAPAITFAGAVYGLEFFPVTWAAMMAACLLCYALGRYAGVEARSHGGKAERIAAFVQKHGAASSFLARLIPAFPFSMQSLLLGAARVPIAKYVAGSALGAAVVTTLFLSVGAAGAKALTDIQRAVQFGWLLPAVGLTASAFLWRAGRPQLQTHEVSHDRNRTGA